MAEVSAFIGLGSNLENPRQQVSTAVQELAALTATRVSAVSSLYRSAPMIVAGKIPGLLPGGTADQPAYINAVARLETQLSAETLLDALQIIEAQHGRVRNGERWGPRTLDLDILLYADAQIDTPRLRVPHPGIAERNFVLQPLLEIAPALDLPGLGALREVLLRCPSASLERLIETNSHKRQ